MKKLKVFMTKNKQAIKKEVMKCYVYSVTAVAITAIVMLYGHDKIISENKLYHYFYK